MKIFVGSVGLADLFAVGAQMPVVLGEVKKCLLGQAGFLGRHLKRYPGRSLFTQDKVVTEGCSLGICCCGPLAVYTWMKNDIE